MVMELKVSKYVHGKCGSTYIECCSRISMHCVDEEFSRSCGTYSSLFFSFFAGMLGVRGCYHSIEWTEFILQFLLLCIDAIVWMRLRIGCEILHEACFF